MSSFFPDLRFAARELRKRPGFTLTAILSLALGIGATSAVFSVIYAVLIDPFPYPGYDRLVELRLKDKAGHDRFSGINGPQLEQLRKAKSIESIVAMDGWNLTTTDGDVPEDVQAMYLSANAPSHWGIPAMMGRWFLPSDAPQGEEPQRVVVLPYQFWQKYYMGDPNVIGRKLQLVHKSYEVIGVMPPRYKWGEADLYVPLKVTSDPKDYFGASVKLKPGFTIEQANAELQPLMEDFAKTVPSRYPEGGFRVNLRSIVELYARPLGTTLYVLLGAVASLLLIGCANVSILLLARGAERQHELAVRAAVGADRPRMIRQLLTEALLIAAAGASLGVLIAWRSLPPIVSWLPHLFPAESVIKINLPVLFFSVGLAFATAIIFGLSPALQLSRPDIVRLMQSSGRRVAGSAAAKRAHGVLVGAQVALTLLLLTVAGAAGKGFLKLVNADLGYDPHYAMSLPIPVHENTHMAWGDRGQYYEQLRAHIASMPQVVEAGISTNATPPSNGRTMRFEIHGTTGAEKPEASLNFISPEYFSVLHIPLQQGRLWDRAETMRGAQVAVVNEKLARQYWPTGNAIGQQIRIPDLTAETSANSPAAPGADGNLQIIGIVADARNDGLRNPIKPGIYVPYTLRMWMFTQVLVRTKVPPESLLHDFRAQITQVDPEQQIIRGARDLEGWISREDEYAQQQLVARLFGIFSVIALLLAAVGLYSVVSYGVANRTNEFGIRMVLGARAADVFRIVLSSTGINVGAGILVGLALSIAFDKLATKWVSETSRDPLLLTAVTALLMFSAVAACLVPARRAATVDPMEALRHD
ncbi:MAG TPA: ABC transporter permease [Candidatus Eisenbacteria bacterium]|jgi:predicted permease|nr:ABC transporter permease [Candidatus Eisenbacteria bacterium]